MISFRTSTTTALLLCVPLLVAAQGAVSLPDLEKCRAIADDALRLKCYDGLAPAEDARGSSAAVPESSTATTEARHTLSSADAALPDDIGLPKPDRELKSVPVTLERCGYASNMMFYVYFENGQVWKYLGRKKLRLKDCGKKAILSEDKLGFKLELSEHSTTIRIARLR